MNCSTDKTTPVAWQFATLDSSKAVGIYFGDAILFGSKKYLISSTEKGHYNLLVMQATLSDSGFYICTDNTGFGERAEAYLTVVTGEFSQHKLALY